MPGARMSAASSVIDEFTGRVDPGLSADQKLEARISECYQRMTSAATDEESKERFSEMCRLIWQRSKTQQIKLELERRMRAK